MSESAKVTHFHKPCPRCGKPLTLIVKMSAWWWACEHGCPETWKRGKVHVALTPEDEE